MTFDAILTAEDIGSYKPSPRNFEYMLAKLTGYGIPRSQILHTAESLFHDHGPANDFGLASCWIHRRHERGGFGATMNPGEMPRTDFRFTSMAALAEAHRAEVAKNYIPAKGSTGLLPRNGSSPTSAFTTASCTGTIGE